MRTLSITISPEQADRNVHSLLKNELALSESHIRRLKLRETGITLNGIRAFTSHTVREGDILTAEIGDTEPSTLTPIPHPLDIVYEDEDLLILNKQANLNVQPTQKPGIPTVENALAAYLTDGAVAHTVSRLDKGTSGLMTVAKNSFTHEALKRLLHTPSFRREYRGIAMGTVAPDHGTVEGPIGFAEGSHFERTVRPDGAPSLTGYEVLYRSGQYTLLRLIPYTGRTHQLRVHMKHLGYPLAGDWLYGIEDKALIPRPALHSYELWLTHPLSGKELHFIAPVPEDMLALLPEEAFSVLPCLLGDDPFSLRIDCKM